MAENKETLPPWYNTECETCGVSYYATRADPRPRPELLECEGCSEFRRGEAEAEAATAELRARAVRAEEDLARVTAQRDREKKRGDDLHSIVAKVAGEGHAALRRAEKAEAHHEAFVTNMRTRLGEALGLDQPLLLESLKAIESLRARAEKAEARIAAALGECAALEDGEGAEYVGEDRAFREAAMRIRRALGDTETLASRGEGV